MIIRVRSPFLVYCIERIGAIKIEWIMNYFGRKFFSARSFRNTAIREVANGDGDVIGNFHQYIIASPVTFLLVRCAT